MGGCRCSYRNCQNTTKTTENIHFFHYPVKHKDRCKIWIENAQKPQFCDLEEEQLRNKVICEIHFEDKWFPNSQKKRLLQGAIPTAGGEEEQEEAPMFVSTDMQDIQVLPASSDGTIFVLDTDTMLNKSQKVESYIYKNGMILPSSAPPRPEFKPSLSKPSTSKILNAAHINNTTRIKDETVMDATLDCNIQIKKETTEYRDSPDRVHTHRNGMYEMEECNVMEYEHDVHEQMTEMPNLQRKAVQRPVSSRNAPEKPILGRNYLRKIKQHSRDIASIKKMLRQKLDSKPDITTILNCIKDQLPPSFFTILALNLNSKCELSDEDVDFFATIHKTSPEVYQLLVDKYKWNLPCVDIVETVE